MKINKKNKTRDLIQLLLVVVIILLINVIAAKLFTRFDLTSEKRYTLADKTKSLLNNLDDIVYFRIYLEGDLNPDFNRLRNATKEMLDEFRAYSNNNVEYEFINPTANSDKKQQSSLFQQLSKKGIAPVFVEQQDQGASSQKIIFPGALVTYKGREKAVTLFRDQVGTPNEVILNNSLEGLEYELTNIVLKLQTATRPVVSFISGHNELDSIYVADIYSALSEFYDVTRTVLNGTVNNITQLRKCAAIIIAKPDSAFSEKDKYILDQYVMQGGKIVWLLDNVYTSMDSLRRSSMTFALAKSMNLDDQLFKYGVRINADLLNDIKCGVIPLPVGQGGKLKQYPWLYFPLVSESDSHHPIVKNMNAVRCEFASSIDTIATNSNIKKTILLTTSSYSNALIAPVRIDLRSALREPTQRQFKRSNIPVAVLLEGEFESVFKNRMRPTISGDAPLPLPFLDKSKPNKMIVVADGDIIKNFTRGGQALPLGFDMWSNRTFGNKNFILNAVNYLCNDEGLLELRSREFMLRILDKKKVTEEKTKWQLINVGLPILILLLFGIVSTYYRRKRYSS